MSHSILIVDDDRVIRMVIKNFLSGEGFNVVEADSLNAALAVFPAFKPEAVLMDVFLPDGNALDMVSQFRRWAPETPLLFLSGNASIDLAVRAIKQGAEHFFAKPVDLPALRNILGPLVQRTKFAPAQATPTTPGGGRINPFLGHSREILNLRDLALKVAATDSSVLISGETGTGKGVLAKWIHFNGPRSKGAFMDINCAGLVREFFETDLFGHQKGAFTGAVTEKKGLLEVAHQGTLFLDEIGDIEPAVQPKLLKVIEEKQFRRIGDIRDRTVDIRLITATHRDLLDMTRTGHFREDLYFRLGTLPLAIPPLRERKEDIGPIALALLADLGADFGHPDSGLSEEAVNRLKEQAWPGNIRELRNILERAVLLCGSAHLGAADLELPSPWKSSGQAMTSPRSLAAAIEDFEKTYIEKALIEESGNVERIIQRLGIARSSLYAKIKKYGIRIQLKGDSNPSN